MATESIFKSIIIKNPRQCKKLVKALEKSQKSKPQSVIFQRQVSEMTREDVRKIFDGGE